MTHAGAHAGGRGFAREEKGDEAKGYQAYQAGGAGAGREGRGLGTGDGRAGVFGSLRGSPLRKALLHDADDDRRGHDAGGIAVLRWEATLLRRPERGPQASPRARGLPAAAPIGAAPGLEGAPANAGDSMNTSSSMPG